MSLADSQILELLVAPVLVFVLPVVAIVLGYFKLHLDRNGKDIILELFPLFFCSVFVISFGLLVENSFSPDAILIPWIYIADVVPWLMILVLAYCLRQRLLRWNRFWRTVCIAIFGLVVGFPLAGLFQNVDDEIGARRYAAMGNDDPYDLYGDESGMRNHGTQQLAQDTWNDAEDGLQSTLALTPAILILAALIYYRSKILHVLSAIQRTTNKHEKPT